MDPGIPPFSAVADRHGTVTVLRLVGELDLATVAELDSVLDRLTAEHPPALVIDARELLFIDSRGLKSLVEFTDRRQDGETVVIPSVAVRRIIQLAALGELLHLVESMEAALDHLDRPAPS